MFPLIPPADIGLFEVDSKEHVRKYDDIDTLNVFRYQERIEGQPPAFLQCGGFVYPLVPGKSPVLKAGNKTYMFPELQNQGMSPNPQIFIAFYVMKKALGTRLHECICTLSML